MPTRRQGQMTEERRIARLRAAVAVGEADVARGDFEEFDATMLDRIEADLDRERGQRLGSNSD